MRQLLQQQQLKPPPPLQQQHLCRERCVICRPSPRAWTAHWCCEGVKKAKISKKNEEWEDNLCRRKGVCAQCVCVCGWVGWVCVQRCQKFVQNYRVAMPPICYNVVGGFCLGSGCNWGDYTMIDKRDRNRVYPEREQRSPLSLCRSLWVHFRSSRGTNLCCGEFKILWFFSVILGVGVSCCWKPNTKLNCNKKKLQ